MAINFDHLRGTYFEECAELLDSAYAQLAALSDGVADGETMHALFRAIHSIKGGGGAFGFDRMVALAHVMETLLDLLRDGKVAITPDRLALLVRGVDVVADMLAAERGGSHVAEGFETALIAALGAAAGGGEPEPTTPPGAAGAAAADTEGAPPAGWRIEFAPRAALLRNANEPLLLVRELRRLGPLTVTVNTERLPELSAMEPEDAYFGWAFQLDAPVARAAIEEIFEFVVDDCELTITPIADSRAPIPLAATSEHALATPEAALATPRAEPGAMAAQSVRVDVAKVDRLVNLVGELVINQAMLVQLGGTLPPEVCPGLIAGLDTLSQHLRELQDGVMAIRTQPVKSVFGRMPRLLRELAGTLGKEARLVVTGENTEIDKTVVEQLADPLTHLLRNALDHGLETPEARAAAGKPRQGTIHLGAEQRSGSIIIEMSDDGRGIDRQRVRARAIERGLIAADAALSDAEIDALIFLPGFSTAETISAVSGRGVGMDVVRRNIQALGGRITLDSQPGAGSRFILTLPLTLAVLDGLQVAIGREAYIIPLSAIVESLRPQPGDIHPLVGGGHVLAIRGAYVPLLPLHQRFGVAEGESDPARGIIVIVETESSGQLGLIVDDLVGQRQIVVKSLEANYGAVEGIGGATILGDGRVALILDIATLGASASRTMPACPPSARGAAPPLH